MSKFHKVSINGVVFPARSGECLLDVALGHGVDLPHDCRTGRCGTCLTRVLDGVTIGGEADQPGMVHACQARVLSDLTLACEPLPPAGTIQGRVTRIVELCEDVVELTIMPARKLDSLPGQYCRFTFQGFPTRTFSPTQPLSGRKLSRAFKLQI